MPEEQKQDDDILSKGLGVLFGAAALAVGVGAAIINSERTRQMREELKVRVDDLSKRVDELTEQGRHIIEERRPEIEQTMQRSRQAAVEGLEKVKQVVTEGAERARTMVEQGAEKAQGTAKRVTHHTVDGAEDVASTAEQTAQEAGEGAGEATGQATMRIDQVAQDMPEAGMPGPEPTETSSGGENEEAASQDNPPGY